MRNLLAVGLCAFAVGGCVGNPNGSVGETGSAITSLKGVDYSFARPSPAGLHNEGYSFVARYYSYDNSGTHGKILFAPEAQALIGAGLDIVSNWEYAADDALNGFSAGVNDAREAEAQAAAAGAPADRPIYFSVDFDATPAQQTPINSYFDGVASVIGLARTGAYGGYYVIQRLFDANKIKWGWQTYAWSGGQWDTRAQLRQVQNGITAAGDSACCDEDVSEADDYGQWGHAPAWKATYVSQSWPLATTALTIKCGEAVKANIVLKNAGTHAWDTNTKLGTTQPRDRSSRFAAADWLAPDRPSHVTGSVGSNGTFQFDFTFQGPTGAACVPGNYKEYFGVVEEGVAWFSDAGQGGPADDVIEANINLVAADPVDMAHEPIDMGRLPSRDGGTRTDGGTVDVDGGVTGDGGDTGGGGSTGGGGDTGGGSTGGGGSGGTSGGGSTGGCSFGGDTHGELPLGLLVIALLALVRRRGSLTLGE